MSFEDEFPSLKGKGLFPIDTNCLEEKDNVFIRGDIKGCCLDKARVKEAIENFVNKAQSHPEKDAKIIYSGDLMGLRKELGLN